VKTASQKEICLVIRHAFCSRKPQETRYYFDFFEKGTGNSNGAAGRPEELKSVSKGLSL
jgi:hypothetical protein